ncbi:MAG: SRPBCC family protein [Pseudomonadota bacterium]
MTPRAVVETEINAPLPLTFAQAVRVDIPSIMPRRGVMPGVARVDNQTGAWDAAGQSRTMVLTDGSSAFEELTAYDLNRRFAYRVSAFSAPLSMIVAEANGDWRFTALSPDKTRITWTYGFTPKSTLVAPLVSIFATALWRGYIDSALGRVKTIIEQRRENARAP